VVDVNGDGVPDLLVANGGSATVSLLFGNGDGTFQAPVNFATDSNPLALAVADLNGDGGTDVVTANYGNNDVTELLNTCPAGTLCGTTAAGTFAITGANSGTLNGRPFSGIINLAGGIGNDSFVFFSGGSLSGNIDGGGGSDTLDYSNISGAVITVTGVGTTGYQGTSALLGGTFTNISTLVGGAGTQVTLQGPFNNQGLNLTLNGTITLTVNGTISGSGTIINNSSLNASGTVTTPVTVNSNQTLTPAAGGLPATLTTGPLVFQNMSTYQVLINGNTSSLVDVTATQNGMPGTVDLSGNPNLVITATNFTPMPNQAFVILQSTGPIDGNFLNLPQGATLTISGQPFVIDYINTSGNGSERGNSFPNRIVLGSLPASTAVAIAASVDQPVAGQTVTFTATVTVPEVMQGTSAAHPVPRDSAPFGSVTFFDNGVQQAVVPLNDSPLNNGTASIALTLGLGPHAISGLYDGMGSLFSASPLSSPMSVVAVPPNPPYQNPNPTDPIYATGADAGGGPQVNVYDAKTGALVGAFYAYDPRFLGGVRVTVADVNGDGVPDIITAPGPGGGPDIRVFDGRTGLQIGEFLAYDYHFDTGVFLAAADLNHDGFAEIITAPDQGGGPDIRVFDGKSVLYGQPQMIGEFLAYNYFFLGGVRIAVGDVNGDHTPDIITAPGPGGGPDIRVFNGATVLPGTGTEMLGEFLAYDYHFDTGVFVTAADVNSDGLADVITAPDQGGGPDVRVFTGQGITLNGPPPPILDEFLAYSYFFDGGVRLGVVTVNGQVELLSVPGPSGGADVRIFNPLSAAQLAEFFAYDPAFLGGSFVGGG
jgi:hypothetical protein